MTGMRLLVCGATGDLTGRYLLPALAELAAAGALPGGLEVVAVAPEPWDSTRFSEHATEQLSRHAREVKWDCPPGARLPLYPAPAPQR